MDLYLKGKRIVVTGGGSGIGAAISETLAQEGATPIILARRAPDAAWLKKINAHYFEVELSDETACQAAIAKARALGPIYGLVNNAGANDGIGLGKGAQAFRQSLNQNLIHYYMMVELLSDELKANQGAIVNISSKTALTGQGGTSAYVAAKAAQLGLTREWAIDFLPFGVRVNAIVVAEVLTPLYQRWLDSLPDGKEKVTQIANRIPLGKRMTKAQEIADSCAFLLSSRASHTTGQWIFADGGYTHLDRALE